MRQSKQLRLGTRGSALALAQSRLFADSFSRVHPDYQIELVTIKTSGDQIQDKLLAPIGGKGLFTKEIEEALLKSEIDFAVHSLKDVPAKLPPGLSLGCFPKRLDARDVLITREGQGLAELPPKAVLGTASLRRRLQILRLRPDLRFTLLRGNIDTRVRRLHQHEFDGIVLAKAGLHRLGLLVPASDLHLIPAPGQGALAIEILSKNEILLDLLKPLHDLETERAVLAERHLMQALGGECNLPLGAFAELEQDRMQLRAFIASPDGQDWIEEMQSGPASDPIGTAEALLQRMLSQGAAQIVSKIHGA